MVFELVVPTELRRRAARTGRTAGRDRCVGKSRPRGDQARGSLRAEYADSVLANLLELAPNGVEEDRGPGLGRVRDLRAAGRGSPTSASCRRPPAGAGGRHDQFGARRLGRPLDRLSSPDRGQRPDRVRPSWWDAQAGLIDVVVDPGRRSAPADTRPPGSASSSWWSWRRRGGASGPLADWGTGSGVLAISAAKLGWGPITAVTASRPLWRRSRRTPRANGVEVAIERSDVREDAPPVAPTVVANLTANLLEDCPAPRRGTRLPRPWSARGCSRTRSIASPKRLRIGLASGRLGRAARRSGAPSDGGRDAVAASSRAAGAPGISSRQGPRAGNRWRESACRGFQGGCRSPSSTRASAVSRSSTSASSRCRRRTTCTWATTRAFPTGRGGRRRAAGRMSSR